jgi:hypothetical protein
MGGAGRSLTRGGIASERHRADVAGFFERREADFRRIGVTQFAQPGEQVLVKVATKIAAFNVP